MPDRLNKIRRTLGGETTLDGALGAMARQREEQVLERVRDFVERVVVIVAKLRDVVATFAADDYPKLEEAALVLDRLESEADDAKSAILDRLSMGGVFFMGRADLARLVTSMDKIANLSAGAADRISMRRFTLPAEMNDLLIELADLDYQAVVTLRDAVAAMEKNLHETIAIAGCVEKLESQADELFARLYRLAFDMDIDFKTFHQFKAIIDRLENIADKAGENAELLRHMSLEYLEV